MKPKHDTDVFGIWSVAWRAFVFVPVGLAAFLLLIGLFATVLVPPVIGATCLIYGMWWQGMAAFALWSLVIWVWRRFRLVRFFESPPSLL
jgi:hypothetical protein